MEKKEEKFSLYNISDRYINFMRKKDSKVLFNKNDKRPYIGIVLEINNVKYFSPSSSPKQKHKSMKNTKDFQKIKNGKLGAINFNLMIPVLDSEYHLIDLKNEKDKQYKFLLQEQIRYINAKGNKQVIESKAKWLYEFRTKNNYEDLQRDYRRKLFQRCCDFSLLEEAMREFQNHKIHNKEVAATKENPMKVSTQNPMKHIKKAENDMGMRK